jgi:predicted acyltransferase
VDLMTDYSRTPDASLHTLALQMSSFPDTSVLSEMPAIEPAILRPRLLSLDALRGFDMFWIIGAEGVVHQLYLWQKAPWLGLLNGQLKHSAWQGIRALDLVFPLFMFLSGITIPYSLTSRFRELEGRGALAKKIAIRVLLLVALGLIYNGLLADQAGPPRFASVLGQIGIAWGVAATVQVLVHDTRQRLLLLASVIGLVTVLQLLVPVPGYGAGQLTQMGAFNAWLDRALLPGKLHGKTFDPEGLLCIFSSCSLTLSGAILGSVLQRASAYTWRLVGWQLLTGAGLVVAGALAWKLGYPPIKALWTGTFDLLAIGISLLTFAAFFAVIDVLKFRRWSFPFSVIGTNALTIYLLVRFVDFYPTAELLFGRLASSLGDARPTVFAVATLWLEWLLLLFLYRRKIFLRV